MKTMRPGDGTEHLLTDPARDEAWEASWDDSPIDAYFRLRREATMVEARAAAILAEIDRERRFEDAGYLSAAALLRAHGDSPGGASRRVAESRDLERHSVVAEAYATAELDGPRVSLLLAAARVDPELFSRDEQMLIDTVGGLKYRDARRALDYWKQAADRQASDADAEHLHERRHLHVSETLGGMVRLDGELDAEGGATVLTALRSLTDPQQLDPEDHRSPAQRRVDALVDICADHLAHGATPVVGATRPQVSAVVSVQALAGQPGVPCELDDGPVISPESARRIACDASLARIITKGDSEILDVGRATRTIPAAIRKALIIRDRHCRFRGCDRPHRWCDAHHIEHWADGGPTSLSNLILLCRRHHRAVHEGGVASPAIE
jgi:hypothetical protein